MKFVSWNVNGLRACLKKDFYGSMKSMDGDVICLQETKMTPDQAEVVMEGYQQFWNSAVRKGYSGTAIFTRLEPITVTCGIGVEEHDQEGRVLTAEFADFYLVDVYTPNAQPELARLDYRMKWEDAFRDYLNRLKQTKGVIVCGDMNVAHEEIDLANPDSNHFNPGFSDQERAKMTELLAGGFTDSFRYLYPDKRNAYSWWSYRMRARERNVGWRIDYFLVSNDMKERIRDSIIYQGIEGSDHCPVSLIIE